jgi:hypothetical protein
MERFNFRKLHRVEAKEHYMFKTSENVCSFWKMDNNMDMNGGLGKY